MHAADAYLCLVSSSKLSDLVRKRCPFLLSAHGFSKEQKSLEFMSSIL